MTTEWMRKAACRDMDTDLFFPVRGSHNENAETVARQTLHAKAVCALCPVLDECRDYILGTELRYENDYGIWGGMTPEERHRERFLERNRRQRQRRQKKRLHM
jgi:WhiB family redox-sensing transcriptional regulator